MKSLRVHTMTTIGANPLICTRDQSVQMREINISVRPLLKGSVIVVYSELVSVCRRCARRLVTHAHHTVDRVLFGLLEDHRRKTCLRIT